MKHKRYLKNIKQRDFYKKNEVYQKVLKSLFLYVKNIFIQLLIQKSFFFKIAINFFKTTIKNFCVISGRSRGVFRKIKMSRITFKQLGEQGLFFGLKKLSW